MNSKRNGNPCRELGFGIGRYFTLLLPIYLRRLIAIDRYISTSYLATSLVIPDGPI
jgi:hypothetical protein